MSSIIHLRIVDPQLGMDAGHFLPYAKSVTKAAIERGLRVTWHTNKAFNSRDLPPDVDASFAFQRYVFDEIQCDGHDWVINNFNNLNTEFYKILIENIPEPDAETVILFPNILHNQLYAVIEWANNFCIKSKVVVILRWNNIFMDFNITRGASQDIRSLYSFCFSRLHTNNDHIIIGSDTLRLASFFSELSGNRIEFIPNPQVSALESFNDRTIPAINLAKSVVISHIGGFYYLRGSHLLPDLFEYLLKNHDNVTVRCHVCDFSSPQFQRLSEVVKRYKSRITVLGNVIDDALYRDLFRTSDLLIMAYHPVFYHYGSSGVACEALSWGVPAVIPANTTIADEFAGVDAGFIACGEWTFEAYAMSLSAAINGIQELTNKSMKAKALYRSLVSPQAFLDRVLA
jgi:glycosyltransferase involved in cell wall biosynthesis